MRRRGERIAPGWRRQPEEADVDLLGQRHDQFAVPFEQPFGVDDRQADDVARRVEAEHMPLGSLLTVGLGLALSDVQAERVAANWASNRLQIGPKTALRKDKIPANTAKGTSMTASHPGGRRFESG
jgi:hypothetical protein